MIEIYKKLPGTNCGTCGVSSCMAFALKVKKSQASLSECPFVAGETINEEQPRSTASSFSSYGQVSQELEKEAVIVDFKETAEAIGGMYEAVDGKEAIIVKMISTVYELRKEGLFQNNAYCEDLWAKIIICDYVSRKGRSPLTGELLPLGLFPHSASLVRAFQSSAQKKIAEGFRRDLKGLKKRCEALGGRETEGKVRALTISPVSTSCRTCRSISLSGLLMRSSMLTVSFCSTGARKDISISNTSLTLWKGSQGSW